MIKTNVKNIIVSFLVVIGLLFLTSCGSSSSSSTNPLTADRTGSQGLEPSFITNSPPSVVYAEDGSFPVTVEVKNKGAFPQEGDGSLTGDIYFVGFDSDIIQNLNQVTVEFDEEEAKTSLNPEGGLDVESSEATIDTGFFESANIDNYEASINAILCYTYKTFASIDVCIDPNPNRNPTNLDTCSPGLTGGGTQGAPIAVSSVDSIPQKGKARFVITISNVGGGQVIKESEIGRCTDVTLEREDLDKITITRAELSNGISLDCIPEGDVSLIKGKATIICKAEGLDETAPAYNSLLLLELTYGYKKSVEKNVLIVGD